MASVVLAGSEFAGFWVDGDALAVGPMAFRDMELVAEGVKASNGLGAEARLQVELVGKVLVVEARSIDGLLNVEAAFGHRKKDIGRRW